MPVTARNDSKQLLRGNQVNQVDLFIIPYSDNLCETEKKKTNVKSQEKEGKLQHSFISITRGLPSLVIWITYSPSSLPRAILS